VSASGVSVVTTTWNERENLKKLIPEIEKALRNVPHETIVVDDNSPDGTIEVARQLATVAVTKLHEGQTKGLLFGMKLAKNPIIITIDADLENSPEILGQLAEHARNFDLVVASRTVIPRFSEKFASRTLGKLVGVTDFYSNYRAYRKETILKFTLTKGETFGAEFLMIAKKNHLKIGQIFYDPPPRRKNPRIGGTLKANLRIFWATAKILLAWF
jgi:dolichol-phosphate mannosyltransferase